jgi:transcriptional regulator of heat shock response
MATQSRTLTGARVKLFINSAPVGIFSSINYTISQGAQDIFVIGSANAKEIVLLDQDTVTVTVSGFRNLGRGPFAGLGMAEVKDIINASDTTLQIIDRLDPTSGDRAAPGSESEVFELQNCKVISAGFSYSARGVATMELTIRGILFKDEKTSDVQNDDGSVTYP